ADDCRQYLAALERRDELAVQIAVLGPGGDVACSVGDALPEAADERNKVRADNARRTSRFAVDATVNRTTGRPGLVLAYPVLSPSTGFVGVVTAPLSADWLADRLAQMPLPAGAKVTVFDEAGTI